MFYEYTFISLYLNVESFVLQSTSRGYLKPRYERMEFKGFSKGGKALEIEHT